MADGIREELFDIIRSRKIGPFGPNSLAILVNGGVSHLTPREAEDITDAILASPVLDRIRAEQREADARIAEVHTGRDETWETAEDYDRGWFRSARVIARQIRAGARVDLAPQPSNDRQGVE